MEQDRRGRFNLHKDAHQDNPDLNLLQKIILWKNTGKCRLCIEYNVVHCIGVPGSVTLSCCSRAHLNLFFLVPISPCYCSRTRRRVSALERGWTGGKPLGRRFGAPQAANKELRLPAKIICRCEYVVTWQFFAVIVRKNQPGNFDVRTYLLTYFFF